MTNQYLFFQDEDIEIEEEIDSDDPVTATAAEEEELSGTELLERHYVVLVTEEDRAANGDTFVVSYISALITPLRN